MNKPAEMEETPTCAELPAERKLPRVEDLDELVTEPRRQLILLRCACMF